MAHLGRILHERLEAAGDRRAALFVSDSGEVGLTARELTGLAGAAASRLRALGLPARSLVGICDFSGPSLYAAWLGCLWAGHVPTMVAPPSPRMEPAKYARGVAGVVGGLGVGALMMGRDVEARLLPHLPVRPPIVSCDDLAAAGARPEIAEPGADDIAVVQHSSGTTGQQKAVALTTAEILAHQAAYGERLGLTAEDRIVSWLPLYHDMGFVAAFLQPLLTGVEVVEMSPFEWANRPAMLLEAVHRHRPTLCWMPNFAFALLAEPRVLRGVGDLDLSSVRAWVNCSEPVMAGTFDRFADALGAYGVSPEALTASYAMAENVFAVTQSRPGEGVRLTLDRQALEAEGRARPAADGAPSVTLVSNGPALPTTAVEVRGADGAALADATVGEICLRGTHRFAGYHNRPDLTEAAIDGEGWYATGDLGFVLDGEVYVTGRKKDLIILRGRNYAAHDIEAAIGEIAGIKSGRVAAFSLPDPALGTERLVILAEGEPGAEEGVLGLEVRKCVAQTFDTTVSDVRIVPDRWLVKSTSGKVARGDNRAKYLETWGG